MLGWLKPKRIGRFIDAGADESKLKRAAIKAVYYTCLGAVVFAYALDMIFFGSHAGTWYLVPLFILVGAVFRTGTVFLPVLLSNLAGTGNHWARAGLRALWVACLIACWFPALSFFAAGHDLKAGEASTTVAATTTTLESKEARIEVLEQRINGWREDRDKAVETAQETINKIDDDIGGTSIADNQSLQKLQGDITTYNDDFDAKSKPVYDQIDAILREKEVAATEKAVAGNVATTWAVFSWLGRWTPVSSHYWSNWGMFYFAMLGEMVAGLGWALYCQVAKPIRRALDRNEIDDRLIDIKHDREIREAQHQADIAIQRSEAEHRRNLQRAADDAKIQEQELEVERLTRLAESEKRIQEQRKALKALQDELSGDSGSAANDDDPNARRGNGGRARSLYDRARRNQRIEVDEISILDEVA